MSGAGICPHHASRRHTVVHEAGHALAALERGLPLLDVQIHLEPVSLRGDPDLLVLGCVRLDTAAIGIVDATSLLEFALAGRAAEIAGLGDALPGGHRGDMDNWRRWVGRTGAMTDHELRALVGALPGEISHRMTMWANDRVDLVMSLAHELDRGERLDVAEIQRIISLGVGASRAR